MVRCYRQIATIALLAVGSTMVFAQENFQVAEVSPLSLSSGAGARIFPSPDAQFAAYDSSIRLNSHVDRYLTLSTTSVDDEPRYFEKPEELPRGFEADAASVYVPFAWSPDSTRLAVTSQPLVTLTDTDLWVFDLTGETWLNLADDGFSGAITGDAEPFPPAGTMIDSQPVWSPDGTLIAVERTILGEQGQFNAPTYALINSTTGEARELTPVPGSDSTGATTALDWSPDGSRLAAAIQHRTPDAEQDGVWLIDVDTGEAQQLATLAQVEQALDTIIPSLEMTSVGPVFWSPDSTKLLLWAGDDESAPIQVFPFVMDAASGVIIPVPIPAHPRDSETSRGLRPLQAAWSPDSSKLIVFAFGLHPEEETTSLDPANTSVRGGLRVIDAASGESQLLGYLPLGTTPLYYAEWAEDGQIIINGYHLTLTTE